MVVKTKGDKNLIKFSLSSKEKGIIRDALAVLKESEMSIKEALDSGDRWLLKTYMLKLNLNLEQLKKDETLDTILVFNGNHFVN